MRGADRAIWRLILFQSILSSCADNAPEPLYKTLLLLKALCLQHMSTFDKALLPPPPTIFSYSGLWNEGANKLAFYVYLCVGVSEGGEREILFSPGTSSQPKRKGERGKTETKGGRERKERKAECFGVTILLLIDLAVLVVLNMTLPSFSHDRNTGDWINTILCSD